MDDNPKNSQRKGKEKRKKKETLCYVQLIFSDTCVYDFYSSCPKQRNNSHMMGAIKDTLKKQLD